jgi:hypothetical protein
LATKAISLRLLSQADRHQYLFCVYEHKIAHIVLQFLQLLWMSSLPVLLSTRISLSMNVMSLSEADVVDVWSNNWFHFSFCNKFRCIGIFLRYVCEVIETPDKSMLSLLILTSPINRNDHTAKMNKNLKKFRCTLFMLMISCGCLQGRICMEWKEKKKKISKILNWHSNTKYQ